MKKRIQVLAVLLLALAMVFSACEGPAGPGGAKGDDGGTIDTGPTVPAGAFRLYGGARAVLLEAAFADNDSVVVIGGNIDGVVPDGKTLYVASIVATADDLDVEATGKLIVLSGAVLTITNSNPINVEGTLTVTGMLEIDPGSDGSLVQVGKLTGAGTVNVTGAIVGGSAVTDTIGAWWNATDLTVIFAPGSRLEQRGEDFLGTAESPTIRNTITGTGEGLKWTGHNIVVTANTTFTTLRGFVVSNGQTITVNGDIVVKTKPGHENHQWDDDSHPTLYAVDSPLEIQTGGTITIGTTGTLKGTGEASWLDGSLYLGYGAVPGIAGTITGLGTNGQYGSTPAAVITGTAYVWQGAWVTDEAKDNNSHWLD
jgi:predicted small secreted protein